MAESRKRDERFRLVARSLDDAKIAPLNREFEVFRKTGYRIFARHKDRGLEGLTDRGRQSLARKSTCRIVVETRIVAIAPKPVMHALTAACKRALFHGTSLA